MPQQKKQLQKLQKSVTPQQKKQLQKKSATPQQKKQLQNSVTPQQKKQLQQLQKSVTPQQKKQLQQLQKQLQQSDIRLKRDVTHVATAANGIKLYSFRYLWSETVRVGVIAQDLLNDPERRDAVVLQADGYYAVDYARLGLRMATFADWQARGLASVQLEAAQPSLAPMPVRH